MMHEAYIMIGGNMPTTMEVWQKVKSEISKLGEIFYESKLMQTEPWGGEYKSAFYNQMICIKTPLLPTPLMQRLLSIEKGYGRDRTHSNTDRVIDLDILLYDDWIVYHPEVIIPHPRLHLRKFCLQPLQEAAPDLLHPLLKKTMHELWLTCNDTLKVAYAQ